MLKLVCVFLLNLLSKFQAFISHVADDIECACYSVFGDFEQWIWDTSLDFRFHGLVELNLFILWFNWNLAEADFFFCWIIPHRWVGGKFVYDLWKSSHFELVFEVELGPSFIFFNFILVSSTQFLFHLNPDECWIIPHQWTGGKFVSLHGPGNLDNPQLLSYVLGLS